MSRLHILKTNLEINQHLSNLAMNNPHPTGLVLIMSKPSTQGKLCQPQAGVLHLTSVNLKLKKQV